MPYSAVAGPSRADSLDTGALDDVARRLGAVVQRSPADETEVIWLQTLHGRAATGAGASLPRDPLQAGVQAHGTVQVRVRERGRVGTYRTGVNSQREVDTAIRQALGQARFATPGPPLPLPRPGTRRTVPADLYDPAVADLTVEAARDLLAAGGRAGEALTLDWHVLRLVVVNSMGLSRATEATGLTLRARCGHGPGTGPDSAPGAGHAAGSARSLEALAAPHILERARERRAEAAGGGDAPVPDAPCPLLLRPEAVAALVQAMADATLSSHNFTPQRSFLGGRLRQRVFDPAFDLTDDGTDETGLPFPFDSDGWPKRTVPMVEAGVLVSPAIDVHLGRVLDCTPTPHAAGFDESRANHLFVAAGAAGDDELWRAADGGLEVALLDDLRVTDPARGLLRATARGVRRVRDGAPAEALPDLVWTASLEPALATLAAVGRRRVSLALHGAWGAATAPALVLTASSAGAGSGLEAAR